jgi:hypothetical protein
MQKLHLGRQAQDDSLGLNNIPASVARQILGVQPVDNFVQGSANLTASSGDATAAVVLTGPFVYSDTADYSDVAGKLPNVGIYALKSTDTVGSLATTFLQNAEVLLVDTTTSSHPQAANGKEIKAFVSVVVATGVTTLAYYIDNGDGTYTATTLPAAHTLQYQYQQRFTFGTMGRHALSNKKFFSGTVDTAVTNDLEQIIKDLYGDLGYGFLNTGNGALGTSVLKTINNHLALTASAHHASAIDVSNVAGLVDGAGQPVVDVQAAVLSIFTTAKNTSDSLSAHLLNAQGAHDSSAIFFDGTGTHYMVPGTNALDPFFQKNAAFALGSLDTALNALAGAVTTAGTATTAELHAIEAGVGLTTGTGVYVADATTNYLTAATSIMNANKKLDTQAKVTADALVAETAARTDADTAIHTELTGVEGGAGLTAGTGAYVANGAAHYTSLATSLKTADDALDTALNTHVVNATGAHAASAIAVTAAGNQTHTNAQTAIDGLQTALDALSGGGSGSVASVQAELDAAEAALGLNTNGTYSPFTGSNFLAGGTINSQKKAIAELDNQLGLSNDALAAETAARLAANAAGATALAAVQSELDATQAGAGLGTAGAYTADPTTNYLTAATSLMNADFRLDARVKVNADANTATQAELDAVEAGAGLSAAGAYVADATTNYIKTAVSLFDADKKIDAQVKTNTDAIAAIGTGSLVAIQNEIDTIETGAGLNTDGTYTADAATNYLTTASSLKNADFKLDAQVKVNTTAITTEAAARAAADTAEATARANADTAEATARAAADAALQTELDAAEAGAGLNANGTYTADGTTNYITGATSLKNADFLLDAQVKINSDAVNAEATSRANADTAEAAARTAADNALRTELRAAETGAGLTSGTGAYVADATKTYINNATTLFNADQKLDIALKALADSIVASSSANGTPVDSEHLTLVHDGATGDDYFLTSFPMVANCVPFLDLNGALLNLNDFTVVNHTDGFRRKILMNAGSGVVAGDVAYAWYRKV